MLGRVCMDQMMVDVTGIPDIHEGDEAILWGGSVSEMCIRDRRWATIWTMPWRPFT